MNTAVMTPGLIDLVFTDWEGTRQAHLFDVSRTSTVGQVVSEAAQSLGLPLQHLYQAVFRGRELDPTSTLEELDISEKTEISLVPEVTAG